MTLPWKEYARQLRQELEDLRWSYREQAGLLAGVRKERERETQQEMDL